MTCLWKCLFDSYWQLLNTVNVWTFKISHSEILYCYHCRKDSNSDNLLITNTRKEYNHCFIFYFLLVQVMWVRTALRDFDECSLNPCQADTTQECIDLVKQLHLHLQSRFQRSTVRGQHWRVWRSPLWKWCQLRGWHWWLQVGTNILNLCVYSWMRWLYKQLSLSLNPTSKRASGYVHMNGWTLPLWKILYC